MSRTKKVLMTLAMSPVLFAFGCEGNSWVAWPFKAVETGLVWLHSIPAAIWRWIF